MFERAYALRGFEFAEGEATDRAINAFVAEYDHGRDAASIAAMTSNATHLFVLLEYWREDGDSHDGHSEQSPPAAVDPRPARRQPRRAASSTDDHARAAERDQPSRKRGSVDARQAGQLKEEDVPLPFDDQIAEMNAVTRAVWEPTISDQLRQRGFTGFHVADCPYWINRDWADCHCRATRPALPDTEIEWPK